MFYILLFVSIACGFLFEIFYNKKHKDAAKQLPGVRCLPFIGNAHFLTGDGAAFYKTVTEYTKLLGARFGVLLGSDLYVVFNSAKDVEVVMSSSEHIDKSDFYKMLHPWLAQGLLTSGGSKWRSRRKMLTPAFHFKILEKFIPTFDQHSNALIEKLAAFENVTSLDVFPLVTLYALDVISESAMGVSVNAQECESSEYVKAVKDVLKIVLMRMKSMFYRFDWIFCISNESKMHNRAIQLLHSYTDMMILNRKQLLDTKESDLGTDVNDADTGIRNKLTFLDLLLKAKIGGEYLNHESIREEVDTFLFEGHDTTTAGICFALHSIAAHEDVQNKLYEEQKTIFAGDFHRTVTYADLQSMKYMDMVIKEVLRLYPSVPIIGRKVRDDIVINDLSLPSGTTIVINLISLHRDPEVFPDPDRFDPERFNPEISAKRNPYAYVVFSAGPRNCIGQKFAVLEMKTVLSKILRSYKLLSVDIPLQLSADLILTSYSGVHIRIVRR